VTNGKARFCGCDENDFPINSKSKIQNPNWTRRKTRRLLRHYFLISVILVAGGLVASGLLEIFFRYRESKEHLALLQQEAAAVAR